MLSLLKMYLNIFLNEKKGVLICLHSTSKKQAKSYLKYSDKSNLTKCLLSLFASSDPQEPKFHVLTTLSHAFKEEPNNLLSEYFCNSSILNT